MPKYAYVNGSYVSHRDATVHIEDRGFQFADGVYEVIALIHGTLADERGHLDRLERSLGELDIAMPVRRATLQFLIREIVRRNNISNANVYIQVTRGAAKRDFPYPKDVGPSLVITTWPFNFSDTTKMEKGVKVVTVPDQRWKRRDIKTVALLPQVLAKQKAYANGAYEAWMVDDDGYVTEGSSSNAWIVTKKGELVTRKATNDILKGVTRTSVMFLKDKCKLEVVERSFTPQEAYEAEEAFCTSAVALISPVVNIDGHKIGDGTPGKFARMLFEEYMSYAEDKSREQVAWTA